MIRVDVRKNERGSHEERKVKTSMREHARDKNPSRDVTVEPESFTCECRGVEEHNDSCQCLKDRQRKPQRGQDKKEHARARRRCARVVGDAISV